MYTDTTIKKIISEMSLAALEEILVVIRCRADIASMTVTLAKDMQDMEIKYKNEYEQIQHRDVSANVLEATRDAVYTHK